MTPNRYGGDLVARLLGVLAVLVMAVGHGNAQDQPSDDDDQPVVEVDPFVEVVRRVRPAVAAVGSYHFRDKPTIQYSGTGFVIDQGNTIVTNAHVVEAVRKDERIEHLRVFFADDDAVRGRPATVLAINSKHDVALIRFEGPPRPTLSLRIHDQPQQGQSVGVMGFPIGLRLGLVPAVHKGVVAAVVPAVLPLPTGVKMTPELAEALKNPYNLYQLDLLVYPGNSGSPLFDARSGQVIGIINKTLATRTREHMLTEPSGISYAVPARWIHELIVRTRAEAAGDDTDQAQAATEAAGDQ